MSKKTALISGHKGFVGKYFTELLIDNNYQVTGVDLKDDNDIRDWLKERDEYYDLVVHLAAIVGGRQTIENEPLSVGIDLSIDAEFFNWVLKNKPGHTIYFSSSAAYPIKHQYLNSNIKLREDMINLNNIASPDFTYGWSKLTGEYLAQFTAKEHPAITVFRPFSGYGTDQDLDYPFPSFIDRAITKQNPFHIWGDGNQIRDFIHIRDVVSMCWKCIKHRIFGTYNIGTGIPTSFNDLCRMVCNIQGYTPTVEHLPSKPTGVMYRVADISKMSNIYQYEISLIRGIEMALSGER